MTRIYLKLQYCSGKLLPPGSKGKPSVTVIWWENKIFVDVSNEFCLWRLETLRRHFSQNTVCCYFVIRIKHDCSTAPPGSDYLLDPRLLIHTALSAACNIDDDYLASLT